MIDLMPEPVSAQRQIDFLQIIQRILNDGGFTSTYKFALLHALADVSISKYSIYDMPVEVSLDEISERITELYWKQSNVFPGINKTLKQNTGGQVAIVTLIHNYSIHSFVQKRNSEQQIFEKLLEHYSIGGSARSIISVAKWAYSSAITNTEDLWLDRKQKITAGHSPIDLLDKALVNNQRNLNRMNHLHTHHPGSAIA